MNAGRRFRIATALSSLIIHAGVILLVPNIVDEFPFLERFMWQYRFLLGLSGFLVILGIFGDEGNSRFTLFLRIGITCLIGFTTGGYPLIPVLLLIAIFQEVGFHQKPPWAAGIILGSTLVILIVIVPEQLVFGVLTPSLGRNGLLIFLAFTLPSAILSMGLSFMTDRERSWRDSVDRLDLAVSKLAEANLGYQGYAQEISGRSIAEERRRVSREIHDTVGYSLTNIRVMLEAASLQLPTRPEETVRLIDQSVEEASLCLEQTRQTMRQLRAREDPTISGLSAIQRLVNAFSEVSGIKVIAEFGNISVRWPLAVEKAVYRLVQEGMTNSLRHGMATEIVIYLWQDRDALRIIVRDNGKSSGDIKEGIGISGMRERVDALGGNLQVGPGPDGFEVKAMIPLSNEEEVDADQNTAG